MWELENAQTSSHRIRNIVTDRLCYSKIWSANSCTQRYGRQTPVSPTERQLLSCSDLKIEIAKTEFFLEDVQRQRSDTSGAHVLGFLGDFGIGNVMEGDAAEASGRERLMQLKALEVGKGCKA